MKLMLLIVAALLAVPSLSYAWNLNDQYVEAYHEEFISQVENWLGEFNEAVSTSQEINEEMDGIQPDYEALQVETECRAHPECKVCMQEARHKVGKNFVKLEKVYVIYKRTMTKYKMMMALADGAAGLTPYAKYAWALQKGSVNSEMNKAKASFFQKYDSSQNKKLNLLNEGLAKIGDCEYEHLGNRNWYVLKGMPLYSMLVTRYKRSE